MDLQVMIHFDGNMNECNCVHSYCNLNLMMMSTPLRCYNRLAKPGSVNTPLIELALKILGFTTPRCLSIDNSNV